MTRIREEEDGTVYLLVCKQYDGNDVLVAEMLTAGPATACVLGPLVTASSCQIM